MATLFNDEFIREYSKKIFRFAYSKTGNIHNAEDLSQEILLTLADVLQTSEDIADLNGYIWTICYYTWSKYLRKNQKHWNYATIDEVFDLQSEESIEDQAVQNEYLRKLQKEISYLSRQNRKIIIMFYFEGKSCQEISKELGISNGAVRWHLYEIRKRLKEGVEMPEQNLSFVPKRLNVGHDGYVGPRGQAGLDSGNLLCQNIVIACYGEALTIEEIARKLGVAAAYLEYHINDLLYLDYLKVVDKNKYQTNFFIKEPKHEVLAAKYHYENIGSIAVRIFEALNKRYDRIKAIGFTGCDLDKDFVLWSLISYYTGISFFDVYEEMIEKNNARRPKRKDGSEHWVCAMLNDDSYYVENKIPKEIMDFLQKCNGNGIKGRHTKLGVTSYQIDGYATIKSGISWRNFDDTELNELYRIKQIIDRHEKPNENDKLMISKMVELGYVAVKEGVPRILVPFFDKEEYQKLMMIFEEIKQELGKDLFAQYINNYAEMMDKHIPDFISKDERYFVSHSIYPQYAVLYYLSDNGYLRYPTDEEAKRICTILWCE